MRLDAAEARTRFATSPVLRLATARRDGQPHVVPCTFVIDRQWRIAIGIDNKPKSTTNLRRLRNISENPRVSAIADHYDEDWNQLWWARADGTAAIEHSGAGHRSHWDELASKYPQYRGQVLEGPIILATIESWSGWAFRDHKDGTDAPACTGNR
jgi:PPOX class probable F420-dependent enzyme